MDQYLSNIILAVIAGIISIVTLLINKKYDKMIVKIDEQALFLDNEKEIKVKLNKLESEQRDVIYDMIVSTLTTNIQILKKVNDGEIDMDMIEKEAEKQKKKFEEINNKISEINKQYDMLLTLTASVKKNMGVKSK